MIIENEFLRVSSKAKGAELTSIFSKQTGIEYLWQAGKEWSKHSPILFPIVGQLKDNTYLYKGKRYELPRHGFARDEDFETAYQDTTAIHYSLLRNNLRSNYPFAFNFHVTYMLVENALRVIFVVSNLNNEPMYFSLGGHPAFNVPLHNGENYNDYYLQFEKPENEKRFLLNNGLLSGETEPVFNTPDVLPLSKELFYKDALVFKNLKSRKVSLRSKKSSNGLHFSFKDFDSFGIWAAMDANFVCLEPWMGHADFVNHNQEIKEKEGIKKLQPNDVFSCSFQIEPF